MYLKQEIEVGEDSLEVTFEAYPRFEDDSYSDKFGLVKKEPYPILDEPITWNQSIYTFPENFIIAIWLTNNFKKVTQIFCSMLREQTIPDYDY